MFPVNVQCRVIITRITRSRCGFGEVIGPVNIIKPALLKRSAVRIAGVQREINPNIRCREYGARQAESKKEQKALASSY